MALSTSIVPQMTTSVQIVLQAVVTAAGTHLEVTSARVQQGSPCRPIQKLVQVILPKLTKFVIKLKIK